MKLHVKIQAFGYVFERDFGNLFLTNEIIKGAVTILTVGIDFSVYV